MEWRRLYIMVEGQTEREFITSALRPHPAGFCIDVKPCVIHTNRELHKRGGLKDFEKLRKDLELNMKQDPENGLAALEKDVEGMVPEDINDRPTHAPSKRIIKHVPDYKHQKLRVGAPAAVAIGLPKLRESCPHFGEWVTKLERLGMAPLVQP